MADRYRQQSILPQQPFDAADRLVDVRPRFAEEGVIRGESMVVGDQCQQFAVTIVLDQPIDPLAIDAAGHEAVGALMRRVPADELAHFRRVPHAQQCRAHHGAVANPGARVAARTRLQCGSGAGHQNVRGRRERRVHGIGHPAVAGPLRHGKAWSANRMPVRPPRGAAACGMQFNTTSAVSCASVDSSKPSAPVAKPKESCTCAAAGSAPDVEVVRHESLVETQRAESEGPHRSLRRSRARPASSR